MKTIEDFLNFINSNMFNNEKDFIKEFQKRFPRTITRKVLQEYFRTKNINVIKCTRNNCNNIKKYKQIYCSNFCCRKDFRERNIVHENWKITRDIRCKNMKISNSKRTPDFYKQRQEKFEKTCLERFGVTSNMKTSEMKEFLSTFALNRWKNKTEEEKNEFAERIRKVNTGRPSQNGYDTWPEEKKIASNMKRHQTKKKNGSYGKSKEEDLIYKMFCERIGSDNIIRQYNDMRYSNNGYMFDCDFYIIPLDLFIEYQGFWTHGRDKGILYGKFNKYNKKHLAIYEKWKNKNTKLYNTAIKVWTIDDPLKREIAKKNHLNWIEFWTVEEAKKWIEENL